MPTEAWNLFPPWYLEAGCLSPSVRRLSQVATGAMGILQQRLQGDLKAAGTRHTEGTLRKGEVKDRGHWERP